MNGEWEKGTTPKHSCFVLPDISSKSPLFTSTPETRLNESSVSGTNLNLSSQNTTELMSQTTSENASDEFTFTGSTDTKARVSFLLRTTCTTQ